VTVQTALVAAGTTYQLIQAVVPWWKLLPTLLLTNWVCTHVPFRCRGVAGRQMRRQ
jgi:hypothetical protein